MNRIQGLHFDVKPPLSGAPGKYGDIKELEFFAGIENAVSHCQTAIFAASKLTDDFKLGLAPKSRSSFFDTFKAFLSHWGKPSTEEGAWDFTPRFEDKHPVEIDVARLFHKPLLDQVSKYHRNLVHISKTDHDWIAGGQHSAVAIRPVVSRRKRLEILFELFDELDLSIFRHDHCSARGESILLDALHQRLRNVVRIRLVFRNSRPPRILRSIRDSIFNFQMRTGCPPPEVADCTQRLAINPTTSGAKSDFPNLRPQLGRARPPNGDGRRPAQSVLHAERPRLYVPRTLVRRWEHMAHPSRPCSRIALRMDRRVRRVQRSA